MAVIGYNTIGGNNGNQTNALNQYLLDHSSVTYVAAADQEVFKLWYYCGGGYVGDGSGVEITVYDITAGTDTAPQVVAATGTIGTLTGASWNSVEITPAALTTGQTYAVAYRIISATNIKIHSDYQQNGSSASALDGTSAFASTWDDNGTGNFLNSVYAETQTSAGGIYIPVIMNHLRNQGVS